MELIDYLPCYRSVASTGNGVAFGCWTAQSRHVGRSKPIGLNIDRADEPDDPAKSTKSREAYPLKSFNP